jgi:hypothetical protein
VICGRSVTYHIESMERLGTSSGLAAGVSLRLTYEDGSSSPRSILRLRGASQRSRYSPTVSVRLSLGRWRVEVGSCRVAGGDGTLAKVDFGAPRRRRPRAPAPPKPPKRCPYQRPGPGPRPPLAPGAGRSGGGDHRAAGPRTGAAAGSLWRGRSALRPRRTNLAVPRRSPSYAVHANLCNARQLLTAHW